MLGPILDWGCGYGDDVQWLHNARGYDPHHKPKLPEKGAEYNTVLCTYVLNTIPEYFDRVGVLVRANQYLKEGGWMYVSIRKGKALKGWTSKGTWQGYVGDQLQEGGFTLLLSKSDMEIYGWQKTPQE